MNLLPNLSVAETILIGREPLRAGIDIDTTAQAKATRAQMTRLKQNIAPDTPLDHLRVGQQQIVESANSLSQDARIPIFDEPTSGLLAAEAEVPGRTMRDLAAQGLGVPLRDLRLRRGAGLFQRDGAELPVGR
ncbi:MAG: ATP-binding cassette domain-containing protein [Paracoccaceae bacterium]